MASAATDTQPDRLAAWITQQVPGGAVRLGGIDHIDFGHSAEMLRLTAVIGSGVDERTQELVIKLRPAAPGLLEPYDLARQFHILQALEPTTVPAPRALWYEGTGSVLGREFYVMEHIDGAAYERVVPPELDAPGRIPRMCESLIDHLAGIHLVDLAATGLDRLGDGHTLVDRELARWEGEMRRVQLGPLPALERLLTELHERRPERSPNVTLVHGDAKPGNFGFVGDDVSAVFDWELTDIGDPMADIGYLELMWGYPVGITSRPSAPPIDDMLARYVARTGIPVHDRPWYLALEAFKTSVITLVGSMLFEAGHSDDMRYLEMALGVHMTTKMGLRALGIDERLDPGPVMPSDARIEAAQARAAAGIG